MFTVTLSNKTIKSDTNRIEEEQARIEQELRSLPLTVMAFSVLLFYTAKAVPVKANLSNTIY